MDFANGMKDYEKMAINGWKIWNNIIVDIPGMEETACFVIIEDKAFPDAMINELITCFINARKIKNICIISDFYDEKNLMHLGKNIQKFQLSKDEIDCLLTYYSIWQFTDCFYVFSFDKMGRQVPDELCEKLSKFEMAAVGILKMKKSELDVWYGQ